MNLTMTTLVLGLAALTLAPAHAQQAFPRYRAEVLQAEGVRSDFITGLGMNDLGQVTGAVRFSPVDDSTGRAFVWSNHELRVLEPLGGMRSAGTAINNRGEVAGAFYPPDTGRATPFLYRNGRVERIGDPFIGTSDLGDARALNERGQVVWELNTSTPMIYENGRSRVLLPDATQDSTLGDINDRGQVVGTLFSNTGCCSHGYVWSNGQVRPLADFGFGSSASAINNRGQVVGSSFQQLGPVQTYVPVLFEGDSIRSLGTLGAGEGNAEDINDAGWIVGQTRRASDLSVAAFVWHDGVMRDLNSLLPAGLTQRMTVRSALDINESGQILVQAELNGLSAALRTLVLTPVPEPTTLAMLLAGLGVVGIAVRRGRGSGAP
jgi:probable HAF family extracellular repeat protein